MSFSQEDAEELNFVFKLEIATEKDYELVCEMYNKESNNFKRVKEYFGKYYKKTFRKYTETHFEQYLKQLDEWFLNYWDVPDLEKCFEKIFLQDGVNEDNFLWNVLIKSLEQLKAEEIKDIKFYFYLYMIANYYESYREKILKCLNFETNILKNLECVVKKVKKKEITLNLNVNNLKEQFSNAKDQEHLLFYIELSMLMKTKKYREALDYLKKMNIPFDCSKDLSEGIKLILEHFDSLGIKDDNKKYLYVYNNLLPKRSSNSNYERTVHFWFLEKENNNQFKNLDSYKDKIELIINELSNNNKSNLLANLLLSISLNDKNDLHNLYNNIKNIMNNCIKEEQNKDYHLLYSLFYVWLLEKIKIYDKVKQFKIERHIVNNKSMDSNIHCIFLYLHEEVRNILLTKDNDIAIIIKDINKCDDNNKTNYRFKYNKNYLTENELKDIEYQVDKDVIGIFRTYKKVNKNQINKDKMINLLKKFCEHSGYKYIIYFDFALSFNEEDLKDIKQLETNEYYYELTGIFITDKSNKKYIIIYNKYTFQWYYVHMSQWTNKLILPKKLNEVYLVYFRTNKSNKDEINLNAQLNYETNITLFNDKNKNNDVYWKSFKNIESSYPNILFVKEPFFKSAFNWDKTKHLQNDKDNNLFADEEDNEPNTETNEPIEENVPPIPSENKTIIPDSLNQNKILNDNVYNSLGNEEDNKQNTETNQLSINSDVSVPEENSLNQNNISNYNSFTVFDNETNNKPNDENNQVYNNIDKSNVEKITTDMESLNINTDDTSSFLHQFEQLLQSKTFDITKHIDLHKWIKQQFHNNNQHNISIKLLFYISFITLSKSLPSPLQTPGAISFNNQSILNEQILTNLIAISSSLEINPNINIQQLLSNINKETIKEHNNYLFLNQIIIYLLFILTNNNTQTFLKEESLSFEEQYLNDLIILLRFTNLEDTFCKYLSSLLTDLNYKEGTDTYKLNLKVLLNIYIVIHIKNEHMSQQCTFIDTFANQYQLIIDALMEHHNHKRIIDILTLFTTNNKDNNYLKNKSNEEKINNIKQYLKDNYTNIRKCIVNTLNESSQSQMIESFDNEFLDKNIDYDSLEYLEKYLFSVNSSSCDDKLLNLIENNIQHIQDVKSYFYFFFISHSDNQWIDHIMNILYKEQSESLVKNMKHIYDICSDNKMKDLFNELKAPTAKTKEEKELIFYTEIFTLIEKNDKQSIINAFNKYIPNKCSKEDEDRINKRINLLLKCVDIEMNYDNQYKSIVEMIISKIGNNDLKYSYEESCIIWLFEKENKNNFKLFTSYKELLEQRLKTIISIFDKHNKNELCANLILSLEIMYKNENVNLYENVKDIMNKCIKEEQNKDYHLFYSLFYVWLLEKIKIYDKVKYIHIGTHKINNKSMYLDVHCVFLYLNEAVRNIILIKDNDIATIIKDIDKCDNNKTIYPFEYKKYYLPQNEFEYINSQVDKNVLGWIQSNENTFNKEKMKINLNNYLTKNGYKYIIYFDFALSFNEEDLKDIKRLDTTEYYYELTGIFITDKSNNKHLIIYNKYTFQWYYFYMSKWSNSLILPDQIDAVNLIYLRTNKDEINLDAQINYETNITLFNDENKDNDVYWKSFKNIESSYPNILFVKELFFKSAFNWDLLALQQQAVSTIETIINNNLFYNTDKSSLTNITNWLSPIYTNTYFTTINSKLLFYISYMLLYKTKRYITLSDSIFLAKQNILVEEQLKNLQKLSSYINAFTFSLKNILKRVKRCETEEDIVYLFLNRIILLLEYNPIVNYNDNINNLKEIVKVLYEDCDQLKPLNEKIFENYFIEIIKYIQEHELGYRLIYLSAFTSILITNSNNGNVTETKSGYYILKEFIIKCLKERKMNDCLDILIGGTETALKILYNYNDDYLIADLLMTSIEYQIADIFYHGCKNYLRDIYYNEQRPLQSILQYSILLFFLFARSKHAEEKIKQMNNLIYMKDDISTLVDITLMFLFTISDIRKIISRIKSKVKQKNINNTLTQEEQNLINTYEIFLNSSEGKKIHAQKNTIFNNIKRVVGNDLYGTKYINKIVNINNSIYNLKYEELKNLKNIQFDNVPYLLYVEYNNQIKDNNPYYKRFISNYNDQYYYEFKGITFVYNKQKDTLLYDKYSQHWYSFTYNSWQNEINFNVITNVKHIYFIYLRKKTTHKGRELHLNNLRNIPPIDEATFQHCYFDYSSTYLWFCDNNQKLAYLYKDSFTRILNTQIKDIQLNYKKQAQSDIVKNPSCLII